MKENVINALKDIKRQIEVEGWTIPTNDKGSGSAGVNFLSDPEVVDKYLHFAETCDNEDIPQCDGIDYISTEDFGESENEIINQILKCADFVERDEIIGLVVCHEHYDMDYTFYLTHIKG